MNEKEKLQIKISEVLNESHAIPEEKLAVMMMFSFKLLSSVQAEMINMRVSDGRVLTLKLEDNSITH
ncbi:hypothetical protein Xsto_03937 [Xenorhabdus stockiae]|uniref:Uncharacterized protein n=1 Tax=Xenorhabdus stockiae TaxID=351614 RepID=A0A2D0KAN3_9GAMM|nr:hypothetical protein [Xenorhabdus stockiae]PHM60506.1 hypothetical protein Xsto_03937 [Xenorhabdus stockiae]